MDYHEKCLLAYKEALNQLREHPKMFWTRNNFFLTITSAFFAVGITKDADNLVPGTLLCAIGLCISVFWCWITVAGQKLQRQWRGIVKHYEKMLFDETNDPSAGKVVGPFSITQEGISKGLSITTAMVYLSAGYIVVWLVLLIYRVLYHASY